MLKSIAKIRYFEEFLQLIYPLKYIRCPIHLSIGHEASAVGVCCNLKKKDKILSYHRSHHHFLAKGGSAQSLLYELLGDSRGCSKGNGGSTHLIDLDNGFLGSTAIISGVIPIATGVAHSIKLGNLSSIVTVFLGDAGIEEGVFFEALNISSLWKLPILFVIEDNNLSCYTSKKVRQSFKSYNKIAELFNMQYRSVNGSSVSKVSTSAKLLTQYIRDYSKPALLHVNVFRAQEHCGPEADNQLNYRLSHNQWPKRDPLFNLAKTIPENIFKNILNEEELSMRTLYHDTLKDLDLEPNF